MTGAADADVLAAALLRLSRQDFDRLVPPEGPAGPMSWGDPDLDALEREAWAEAERA